MSYSKAKLAMERLTVLKMVKNAEILTCQRKMGGDCNVILLPVLKESKRSIKEAQDLVDHLRPNHLFLQLEHRCHSSLLKQETTCAFEAAFERSKAYPTTNVILGDLPGIDMRLCWDKKYTELLRKFPHEDKLGNMSGTVEIQECIQFIDQLVADKGASFLDLLFSDSTIAANAYPFQKDYAAKFGRIYFGN